MANDKSGRSLDKDAAAIEALSGWAQTDYAAALAFAKSLTGKPRNQVLAAVLGVMARTQAETAWWQVRNEDKTGHETSGMARVFFRVWAGIDRAAAVRFADSHAEVESYFLGSSLIEMHGAHPASLLPIVAQVQRAQLRAELINTLANEWPTNDMLGLLAFQDALPLPKYADGYSAFNEGRKFRDWATRDPMTAAAAVATMKTPAVRQAAWKVILQPLTDDSTFTGLQSLMRTPYAAQVAAALGEMSLSVNVQPQEQQALLQLLPDGAAKQKLITSMAKNAAENFDIQRAEELLQMLPADQGGEIYTTLADHWTDNDLAAADAWIATLPLGSAERSWAEVGRVRRLLIEHNSTAVTFVDRITDLTARKQAMTAIAQWWNRSDSNGLRHWLAQRTELTPIERMELEVGF